MPLYDYECQSCGHAEEIQRPLNDPHPDCPQCGATGGDVFIVLISPPQTRVAEISGPIFSEKQIESTHGRNWRNKGTSGRPGGAGRRIFFHR